MKKHISALPCFCTIILSSPCLGMKSNTAYPCIIQEQQKATQHALKLFNLGMEEYESQALPFITENKEKIDWFNDDNYEPILRLLWALNALASRYTTENGAFKHQQQLRQDAAHTKTASIIEYAFKKNKGTLNQLLSSRDTPIAHQSSDGWTTILNSSTFLMFLSRFNHYAYNLIWKYADPALRTDPVFRKAVGDNTPGYLAHNLATYKEDLDPELVGELLMATITPKKAHTTNYHGLKAPPSPTLSETKQHLPSLRTSAHNAEYLKKLSHDAPPSPTLSGSEHSLANSRSSVNSIEALKKSSSDAPPSPTLSSSDNSPEASKTERLLAVAKKYGMKLWQ